MRGKLAPGGAAASSSMRHKWYEKNAVQLTTAASFTLHWQIELTEKDSSIQKSTPTTAAWPRPLSLSQQPLIFIIQIERVRGSPSTDWLPPFGRSIMKFALFSLPISQFLLCHFFFAFCFFAGSIFFLYFLLVFSSKCKCHSSRIMQYKLLQLERSYSAEHGAAPGAGAAAASAGVDNPSSSRLSIRKEEGKCRGWAGMCATRRRLVKSETTKELGQGIVHVNYSS